MYEMFIIKMQLEVHNITLGRLNGLLLSSNSMPKLFRENSYKCTDSYSKLEK